MRPDAPTVADNLPKRCPWCGIYCRGHACRWCGERFDKVGGLRLHFFHKHRGKWQQLVEQLAGELWRLEQAYEIAGEQEAADPWEGQTHGIAQPPEKEEVKISGTRTHWKRWRYRTP